jgi:adenosylcobinamide-GDP ribazoletransferase
MFRNFVTALQFLTIFTIRKDHKIEESEFSKSLVYFPLVGFLIGFILVNADKFFTLAALPQSVATFLLVVLSILITRAIHVDGLADTFDGLMGGHDEESRLAIMRDSRIGTAGVVGIVCVLFLKYLCLNNLYESDRIVALLAVPMLGRWSQIFMVYNARYGREDGMAKAFVGHLRASSMTATTLFAACLSAFVVVRLELRSAVLFLCLMLGVVLFTMLGKRFIVKRIGGVTGDSIGAMSELNEVLALLIFVLFSSGGN